MQRIRTALTAILFSGLWSACGIFQPKASQESGRGMAGVAEDGTEVQFTSAFLNANAQYLAGNYDAAYLDFQKLEKERPDLAAIPWRLAEIKLAQKQAGSAVVHIRRATALDPENTWYREIEAKALEQSGEYDGALSIWSDLLRRFPTRAAYYQEAVRLCLSRQKYDKAVEVLNLREKQFGMREQRPGRLPALFRSPETAYRSSGPGIQPKTILPASLGQRPGESAAPRQYSSIGRYRGAFAQRRTQCLVVLWRCLGRSQ